jgi:hypothetical protein
MRSIWFQIADSASAVFTLDACVGLKKYVVYIDPNPYILDEGGIRMHGKITFAGLVALLTLGLVAAPALAMKPLAVQFEVAEDTVGPIPDYFYASGSAVDEGLVCSSGTVIDLPGAWTSGPPGGTFTILHTSKHFECDDGSGTFDVRMVVRLDLTSGGTTANWFVIGGTGAYSTLKGNGSLVGIPGGTGVIIDDTYDGKLH